MSFTEEIIGVIPICDTRNKTISGHSTCEVFKKEALNENFDQKSVAYTFCAGFYCTCVGRHRARPFAEAASPRTA
jgi:hypothetical protein